jgi:CRP-like cAMP-binding protein
MQGVSHDQFLGLPGQFFKDLIELGEKEVYEPNHVIFKEGEAAEYFYILTQGKVNISVGEAGHTVYTVTNPGEVFGWSCVLERGAYSASAETREKTTVVRIKSEKVSAYLEKDPAKGLLFYKAVARILVNRLLQLYRLISEASGIGLGVSYGTGQVTGSKED